MNGTVYLEVDCLSKHKVIHTESNEAITEQVKPSLKPLNQEA